MQDIGNLEPIEPRTATQNCNTISLSLVCRQGVEREDIDGKVLEDIYFSFLELKINNAHSRWWQQHNKTFGSCIFVDSSVGKI